MFSVSLLYSIRDFLKFIPSAGITTGDFRLYFTKFKYSTADNILNVSSTCGWFKLNTEGVIILTDRGRDISELDYSRALLIQLEDLISHFNPFWGGLLTKGRTEAKNFLPDEVVQCFRECGLFGELDDSLVAFWDKLAMAYRNYSQKRMTEIGRIGEKLSLEYELKRTGLKPIWQAVESNLSGFDILSVTDNLSKSKLQIEVKATTSNPKYANIHVSRNEWGTAINSENFIFHLWHLEESPSLYEVGVDSVARHIPQDLCDGKWESVEIPFHVLV